MIFVFVSSCSVGSRTPVDQNDACSILKDNRSWKRYLIKTHKKWNVKPSLVLSFIKTESNFRPRARTQRKYFLGLVPTGRISSAYGYAQALDGTWERYEKATNRRFARRNKFSDAVDFIGWYVNKTTTLLKIPKNDAYRQYLAYYKGWGDYKNYSKDKKAIIYARSVKETASKYRKQLTLCRKNLDKNKYIIF